ncbi:mycofactocin oligosaccharide methyltransferase MftM [Aquipuribacter sp. MA13-6]|uniref:mycofactocin oligosaccharide methyltransferase MftM n=1 Tax=unclassified Aquipuribacter TaxID=2635084 RepID=UPI003EEE70C2
MRSVPLDRAGPRPIDPLAPMPPGRYEDDLVVVVRAAVGPVPGPAAPVVTEHFETASDPDGRLLLRHRLRPDQVDDDLAGLLQAELFGPGWLTGSEVFERCFTGVVRSCHDDALQAWERFYRNTLARLQAPAGPEAADRRPWHGSLEEFAPVHRRGLAEVTLGPVLDLGSCFGFFPLQLAGRGEQVTASDVSEGTMRLLAAVAPRLGGALDVLRCDAARVPLPDGAVRTVTALHLLEHVPEDHGRAVLAEACRLATDRVVLAVPLEDEATAAYGHVRTLTLADLRRLGRSSGWAWRVTEDHGGWLVLDRPGPIT